MATGRAENIAPRRGGRRTPEGGAGRRGAGRASFGDVGRDDRWAEIRRESGAGARAADEDAVTAPRKRTRTHTSYALRPYGRVERTIAKSDIRERGSCRSPLNDAGEA